MLQTNVFDNPKFSKLNFFHSNGLTHAGKLEEFKFHGFCGNFFRVRERSRLVFIKSLFSLGGQSCDWEMDNFP